MKPYLLLFTLCAFVAACGRPIGTVPEITPQLQEVPIEKTTDSGDIAGIAPHKGNLVLVRTSGAILKLDSRNTERLMAAQVADTLRPGITYGEGRLLLRTRSEPSHWVVFNMDEFREITAIAPATESEQVVTLGRGILVTRHGDHLAAKTYDDEAAVWELDIPANEFRSCQVRDGRVSVLTRSELLHATPPFEKPQRMALPHPAAGDFLLRDGWFYYGSENRMLVKCSLRTGRAAWTAPLPRILKLAPLNAGDGIAVLPEDQHIHFFSLRGGRTWWSPLEGTRLFPPLSLKDNIAVFLYPPQAPVIRFFNWKKRTALTHKGANAPRDPPLAAGGKIFMIAESGGKTQLLTLTNRRTVDINIEPKFPRLVGRSLEFQLNGVNLIQPQFTLELRRWKSKETLLKTTLQKMERPTMAWFPSQPGEYLLEVDARSRDGYQVTAKKRFRVFDLAALTREYISAIQAACSGDQVAGGAPAP